jgi:hypothetical protein
MVVVGLVGEMRSGKTLMMTILLLDEYLSKKEVLSNYHLNFPHQIIDVNEMDKSIRDRKTDYFENKAIGIDEIHVFMDSRGSGQKRNKMLSYFLTQSGKLDTTIYWTSQFMRQVDVRLRLNTQILYKVKRYVLKRGVKVLLRQDDKRHDFYIDAEKYVLMEGANGLFFGYKKTITIKNPSNYFKWYDTKQRVYYEESIDEKEKKEKEEERKKKREERDKK